MQLQPDICSQGPMSDDVLGAEVGSSVSLMIETPHPVHTHSKSSLYIYKVFQHLLQWLKVIRMQPYPNIQYLLSRCVEGGVSEGI